MGGKTEISWTDFTWNPLRGCSRVSAGCANCYAATIAARFSYKGAPYQGLAFRSSHGAEWTGIVSLVESALDLPLDWRKPRRIFVNSMSDLFHERVTDDWIDTIEIGVDTGIMSGADIVASVALGARFTMIGRAYLYGLMAGGRRGVDRTIEILGTELVRTMKLLGVSSLAELGPQHVTQLERLTPRPRA